MTVEHLADVQACILERGLSMSDVVCKERGTVTTSKVVVFGAIQVSAEHDLDDVFHKYIAPDDPRATEWFVLIDHGEDRPYEFPAVFSFESRQEAEDAAGWERRRLKRYAENHPHKNGSLADMVVQGTA